MTESHDGTPSHLQELTELLRKTVEQANFNIPRLGVYQSPQFRDIYYRNIGSVNLISVSSAQPQLGEDLMKELMWRLHDLLSQYIVDDHIGNGFVYIVGGISKLKVVDFALDVVRAAAILGPEQVIQLLHKWANGEPVPYHMCAVLSGITVDQPMEMEGGIRFRSLPNSSADLALHLPLGSTWHFGVYDLMDGLKVTIDCKANPALYRPGEEEPAHQITWAHGTMPRDFLNTLCETLSLTLNHYVDWSIAWSDFDKVETFGMVALQGYTHRRDVSNFDRELISQEHLTEVNRLLLKRLSGGSKKRKVDIAINRWIKSKRNAITTDQLVDLRIALESLYLTDVSGESRFRVSNYSAWHLGADFHERLEYQKTIRDAYDLASKAVHTGTITHTEENRNLLTAAQDLCRKGILKRLDETEEPNWNALILGKDT